MVSRAILNGWPIAPPSRVVSVPIFLTLPSLSGIFYNGQTITLSTGTITGFPVPAVTVQWYREDQPVAGATGLTYTLTDGDVEKTIYARVTATNSLGSSVIYTAAQFIIDLGKESSPDGGVFIIDFDGSIVIDNDATLSLEAA